MIFIYHKIIVIDLVAYIFMQLIIFNLICCASLFILYANLFIFLFRLRVLSVAVWIIWTEVLKQFIVSVLA